MRPTAFTRNSKMLRCTGHSDPQGRDIKQDTRWTVSPLQEGPPMHTAGGSRWGAFLFSRPLRPSLYPHFMSLPFGHQDLDSTQTFPLPMDPQLGHLASSGNWRSISDPLHSVYRAWHPTPGSCLRSPGSGSCLWEAPQSWNPEADLWSPAS